MTDPGFLIVEVENKKAGLPKTKLEKLFYGSGAKGPDSAANLHRLMSWEIVDSETEMDSFSFTLDNSDLSLFDSKLLAKGNKVTMKFGTEKKMSLPMTGVIQSVTGWRTMTVSGNFSGEIALANNQATEKFLKKKYSQIAQELFIRAGLKAVVEDTKMVIPVTIRTNATMYQFLKKLTDDLQGAYEVYVDGDTGYFVKKGFKAAPITVLRYGTEASERDYRTVGEPHFESIQQNVATEETVRGFDLLEKKPIDASASNKTSEQKSLGSGTFYHDEAAGVRKFAPATATATKESGRITTTQKQKEEEAKNVAGSAYDSKNARAFTLKWSIIGDQSISAKKLVQVQCDAKSVSGKWYVERVRHSGSPFMTELFMIRNALGQAIGTQAATPIGGENKQKAAEGSGQLVKWSDQGGNRVPVGGGG